MAFIQSHWKSWLQIVMLQSLKKPCGYQGNLLQPKIANTTSIFRKNKKEDFENFRAYPCKDCEACPFGIHLQTHESYQE